MSPARQIDRWVGVELEAVSTFESATHARMASGTRRERVWSPWAAGDFDGGRNV